MSSSPAPASTVPIPGTVQYNGRPCIRCGEGVRYLRNRACVACTKTRAYANTARTPLPKLRKIRRRAILKRTYNITPEQVEQLLRDQGGVCAICRSPDPRHQHGWHVDHDHATGVVRGVLCPHCNSGLGHFRDSIASLTAAIAYLSNPPNGASK